MAERLMQMTVEGLLTEFASDSPAPGGGSAAALAGAVAASLCEMVAGLALGREKLKEAWQAMEGVKTKARHLGTRFRELVDEDTEAYASVVTARRLPKENSAQKAARDRAIQESLLRAARVPLETLHTLAELSGLALLAAEKGNRGCITDAGAAALMIEAGAQVAAWNVRVNLPGIRDTVLRDQLGIDASAALALALETATRVRPIVDTQLSDRSGTQKER
jgi:methenyltetrahydrofolate cyclohydrolase